jgi:hypothetical protein
MTMHKAREIYQSLTPEQKNFVDNKVINTTLSIKHWKAFLTKAAAYDKENDEARISQRWHLGISIVAFVVLVIAGLGFELTPALWFLLIPIFFIVTAAVKLSKLRRRNMSDYLRNFFLPLLDLLVHKAGADAKLTAALDFKDPFVSLKPQVYQETVPRKQEVKLYEPKMIAASVELLDKSQLEWVLMDEIKKISYRNPRGKHKSKTKTLHRLFIRLTVPKTSYQRNTMSVPSHVEMEEQGDNFVFKLKHKSKEQALGILQPNVFTSQVGMLYGLMIPVAGGLAASAMTAQATQAAVSDSLWSDRFFTDYDQDGMRRTRIPDSSDTSPSAFDS